MYILQVVQPARRGRSVRRGEGGRIGAKGFSPALDRIDEGACYTRGLGLGDGAGGEEGGCVRGG